MFIRYFNAAAVLLLASLLLASMSAGQANQAANDKQKTADSAQQKDSPPKDNKESTDDAMAALMGIPPIDKQAVERGRKIFVPTCGFCHGNDARGKNGPDLVRSPLALHDNKGDTLGPVIREGRPNRGMPAFPALTAEQITDISTFLHSRAADVTNRFAYKMGDLITGDAQKGATFFNGDGHCVNCHSPTGDLAHVAGKYAPEELQRRMLYPAPNEIDMILGKAVTPPKPATVTVKLASGEQVTGTLVHLDEFTVMLRDASGWERSFSRENAVVEVQDPRAEHKALWPRLSDEMMHNLLAYLETLK